MIKLINEGKIKHTVKWAKKASDEELEKTYANYLTSQLDETNEHIAGTLIKLLSGLMTTLGLVCGTICVASHVMKKSKEPKDE